MGVPQSWRGSASAPRLPRACGRASCRVIASKPSKENSERQLKTVARKLQRKVHPKSIRNRPKINPKSIAKRSPERPGSHREAQGRPRAPRSAPRSAQSGARRGPESPLGPHRGASGTTRWAQRARKEGQRTSKRGSGRRKIEPEAPAKTKKVNFDESAPRPAPADAPDTSDPPKSTPNRLKIVPSRPLEPLERPPQSTLVPRMRLGRPQRATRDDSGRLGSPQGSPKGRSGRTPPALPRKAPTLIRG